MCDKLPLPVGRERIKKIKFETTLSHRTVVKKFKNNSKNFKRRNRRKRSKKAYLNMLRGERTVRNTEQLCNSIHECSVMDMDVTTTNDLGQLPREISEWQKHEQLIYWKSRAISLELENRMLRQHLRNVYAQDLHVDENNKNCHQLLYANTTDNYSKHGKCKLEYKKDITKNLTQGSTKNLLPTFDLVCKNKVFIKNPVGKNRLGEMEKIYGNVAPKIMGMETAVELNYERLVEEGSAGYWPTLPIKL